MIAQGVFRNSGGVCSVEKTVEVDATAATMN